MKFLRDDEMPASGEATRYRETAWNGLVAGLLLLGLAAGVGAWSVATQIWSQGWVAAIPLAILFILLVVARMAFRSFTASRRPESWRLAWSHDGLYLRYRSYLNFRFAADTPTILFLTRREVHWLKVHKERLDTPDHDGGWSDERKYRWLEVALRRVDPAPIRTALSEEARRRTAKGGRYNDLPVTVTREGTLRVALRRPERVAAMLAGHYPVAQMEAKESGDFRAMSREEKEDHVLALAAAGDSFGAIKAAREVYGFDLARARAFVEELQGRA